MQTAASFPKITIGVDLGDRKSHICEIDEDAQIVKETSIPTTAMDMRVERIAQKYPEVERLQQLKGVGALTALTFVLLVEDPKRFKAASLRLSA